MVKFKGVIFDLDGVLCHTDEYHYLAWKQLAQQEGIYFDRLINQRLLGISRSESLEIVLERAGRTYTQAEKSRLAERKNELYRQYLLRMTPADLTTGAEKVLQTLEAAGVKLAVGSSSRNARFILDKLGISSKFQVIIDGNVLQHSKPDKEVFCKALAALHLAADQCLVVEDAVSGIQAAVSAGIKTAGIGKVIEQTAVDYTLHAISDLLPVVLGTGSQRHAFNNLG